MQHLTTTTFPLDQEKFSMIIDARSPTEFAEDHIPGAINLPVLFDDERELVGKIYRDSPFEARKLGASLVSKNISQHIQEKLIDYDQEFAPLLYCWRGGMRSRSFALILRTIGWKSAVVDGGYQTFRRYVIESLDTTCANISPKLKVISGLTGVGKTKLLKLAANQGVQILDLEALAKHKGSLLGDDPAAPQPKQKSFESSIWLAIKDLDPNLPVYVESESNRIGSLHIPAKLWKSMEQAEVIDLQLDINSRVQILLEDYEHFTSNTQHLSELLNTLRRLRGNSKVDEWQQMLSEKNIVAFVKDILVHHYDIAYRRPGSIESRYPEPTKTILLDDHTESSFLKAIHAL